MRKSLFPPRPRKRRKPKLNQSSQEPVKLESLQSCLNGLSQDSGIGSSQELTTLQLDKIVVPSHLQSSSGNLSDSNCSPADHTLKRKRQFSESSLSDFEEVKRFKSDRTKSSNKKAECRKFAGSISGELNGEAMKLNSIDSQKVVEKNTDNGSESLAKSSSPTNQELKESLNDNVAKPCISVPENKELCIICNVNPKNSIFLHGNIGHMCSCYKCSMRTWGTNKRCPVCNCKVRNVIKVFTA